MNKIYSNLKPTLQPFMDQTTPYSEADYVIIGVPMDLTASYRRGTKNAPDAIRKESIYLESYSIRTGMDLDDITLCDLGNLRGEDTYESWMKSIEVIIKQVIKDGKTPILIGGEHSISHGAINVLKPDLVISFDAHMDLRDQLFNQKLSHATFMRRAYEEQDFKLGLIGARAFSREEIRYAKKNRDRISFTSSREIMMSGVNAATTNVREFLNESDSIYITVDMDVLDICLAPAVGNPTPEGLTVTQVLDIINDLVNGKLIGFDVNEVSPSYDTGLTAIHAAYIILETIYSHASSKI